MRLLINSDHTESSGWVADQIITAIQNKPDLLLCMASGDSPALTCELLVKKIKADHIDVSSLYFIGLDEWLDLDPADPGSCVSSFYTRIINPLGLSSMQYHFFNTESNDLEAECKDMNALIERHGGIDMMIVGIGMNGHIGFNEPGTPFDSHAHCIDLDDTTKSVGQKYFETTRTLTRGITIGLGQLLKSKTVIAIANGSKKSDIIRSTILQDTAIQCPSTVLKIHHNSYLVIDKAAASKL